MTNDEAKAAFLHETPVVFGGVRYDKITALIYRKNPEGIGPARMTVELLDPCHHAVVIVEPERVTLAKEGPGNV